MSEVKGELRLEFDDKKLKADLIFSPNKDGRKWSNENITQLLRKNDLGSFADVSRINDALKEFRKNRENKEPVIFTIATGIEAGNSLNDLIEWQKFSIPEGIKDKANNVFLNAGTPDVFEILEIKTKVQEKEKVKASLPFLPAKEKEVTRVLKKEVRKKATVSSDVVDSGYIRNGNTIAVIKHGKIGKPGKDVLGKMVPPEKPSKAVIYISEGIQKNKDRIIAEKTGFLRRGENWVEIFPYQMQETRVYTSKDGSTCLIDFIPGKEKLPEAGDILKRAVLLNFNKSDLISEEKLTALLNNAVKNNTDLKSKSISLPCDSVFQINVSEDRLKAFLTLKKHRGAGKPLSLKEIGDAISTSGFKDMNIPQIRKDILKFYKEYDFELQDYILATGTPPVRGRDASINFVVDFLSGEEAQKIRKTLMDIFFDEAQEENSPIYQYPVEELNNLSHVKKNDKIAELNPYSEGKPGTDVYGIEIPGVHGNDPDIKIFEGIKINSKHLICLKDGVLGIARVEKTFFLNVFDYEDSDYKITVSDDNMQAFLTINPSRGAGIGIQLDKIKNDLKEKGILTGINNELLENCVKEANNGKYIKNIVIAKGIMPRHGSGSRLHFYYPVISGRTFYSGASENKKRKVNKGDLIAEIAGSTSKPENGKDISGNDVPAREGLPIKFDINDSIKKESTEDGKIRYYAAAQGEIFYTGNLLEVKDSLVINSNISKQTGNINFTGSVQISGSVKSGLSIFSGGDIKIAGMVEGALLSSNGSIIIGGGVRGGNKAVLRSKQSIAAAFAEQSVLLAVGNVQLKTACLSCSLKCNNKLFMAPVNSRILGGSIKSKKGLEVFNIGSERGVQTQISFGQDYLVGDQIELEERELEKLKKKIYTFDHIMMKIEKGEYDKKITLEQIRKEKLKVLKLIETRGVRLLNLREKFEEHFPSEIIIRGTLFPGTVFESHGRIFEVHSKQKGIKIFFDLEKGHIHSISLGS